MKHTPEQIIEQCVVRWRQADDFDIAEFQIYFVAAQTILNEIKSERAAGTLSLADDEMLTTLGRIAGMPCIAELLGELADDCTCAACQAKSTIANIEGRI